MAVLDMGQQFEDSTGEIFPTAPVGTYDVRITGVTDKISGENSKHPGTPMWKVDMVIEGSDSDGVRLTNYQVLPMGPGTEWMEDAERTRRINEIKRLWNACGLTAEGGAVDSDDLLSCQLQAVVGVEEFNGKDQNTIKDLLAI